MPGALAWGYDTTNKIWLPVQVDANGRLKVDMSAINLDDLGDVSVPTPADGDVIYFDQATGLWKCTAISGMEVHGNEYHYPDMIPETLLTAQGDIITRDASAPKRLAKGNEYQVLTMGAAEPQWSNPKNYIAGSNEYSIFSMGTGPSSLFTAKVNAGGSGGLTATNVPYDNDSGEGFLGQINWALIASTKFYLWNTIRGTARVATGIDTVNNKITTEASTDAWADNDDLTTQSQVNTGANYFDLGISNFLTANSVGVAFQAQIKDTSLGLYYAQWHPFEAVSGPKEISLLVQAANTWVYIYYILPVVDGKICMRIFASGANSFSTILKYLGRIDMA